MSASKAAIHKSKYSVAVAGAMNPAIHHPQWYQAVSLLSADETHEATTNGSLLMLPQLSKFQTSSIEIHCLLDKWLVATADVAQRIRIVDLAADTFDKLSETPVTSYGINYVAEVETSLVNVGDNIGSSLAGGPFRLQCRKTKPSFHKLAVSFPLPQLQEQGQPAVDRRVNVSLAPSSASPKSLIADFNVHHEIVTEPPVGHFDLPVLIRSSASVQEECDQILSDLLVTFSSNWEVA